MPCCQRWSWSLTTNFESTISSRMVTMAASRRADMPILLLCLAASTKTTSNKKSSLILSPFVFLQLADLTFASNPPISTISLSGLMRPRDATTPTFANLRRRKSCGHCLSPPSVDLTWTSPLLSQLRSVHCSGAPLAFWRSDFGELAHYTGVCCKIRIFLLRTSLFVLLASLYWRHFSALRIHCMIEGPPPFSPLLMSSSHNCVPPSKLPGGILPRLRADSFPEYSPYFSIIFLWSFSISFLNLCLSILYQSLQPIYLSPSKLRERFLSCPRTNSFLSLISPLSHLSRLSIDLWILKQPLGPTHSILPHHQTALRPFS